MRIELKISGAVRLTDGQTLRVVDGAGTTVTCKEGTVWVTEENQPRDLVLQVRNYCIYHKLPKKLSREGFDFAVSNYFSVM